VPGRRATRLATLLLLAVTAAWGSTFFLIRDLVVHIPSADFLAVRFLVAASAMTAVFHRHVRALPRRQLGFALVLGAVYGGAQLLQTIGLEHTSASVSGFVTGAYVVLTPLFAAAVLRERLSAATWGAVALATVGLAVLSLRGFALGLGEGITLLAAVLYALHILGLGRWSTPAEATGMAAVQAWVIMAVTGLAALPGGITMPSGGGQWLSLLYMALIAGAFALWAQTWAQAHLTATRAAIVMTTEPVFAALFALAFGGESLTSRMLVGGSLVLAAMYVCELAGRRPTPSRRCHRRRRHSTTTPPDPLGPATEEVQTQRRSADGEVEQRVDGDGEEEHGHIRDRVVEQPHRLHLRHPGAGAWPSAAGGGPRRGTARRRARPTRHTASPWRDRDEREGRRHHHPGVGDDLTPDDVTLVSTTGSIGTPACA
jgi:drug/metabolite transporter (DMT)-like permease